MGYYIVATKNDDVMRFRQPKEAANPEAAVLGRGVIPEDHEEVRVFQTTETPAGDCKFWDKGDLDFTHE